MVLAGDAIHAPISEAICGIHAGLGPEHDAVRYALGEVVQARSPAEQAVVARRSVRISHAADVVDDCT